METLTQIIEKDILAIELPFQDIAWNYDGNTAEYYNREHTIDCEEYMIVFELSMSSEEGDERNNAWVGSIKEYWYDEELIELDQEQEQQLREKLTKHFDNPLNAN